MDGLPLLALRFVATGILAEISYRFVETPIRSGALGRGWRALREAQGGRRRRLGLQWGTAMTALAALSLVLGVSAASAKPPAPPEYLTMLPLDTPTAAPSAAVAEPTATDTATALASPTPAIPTVTAGPAVGSPTRADTSEPAPAETPTATTTPTLVPATSAPIATPWPTPPDPRDPGQDRGGALRTPTRTPEPMSGVPTGQATAQGSSTPVTAYVTTPWGSFRVTAIGDSVMMGAARELQRVFGEVNIDVSLGRSVPGTVDLLKLRRDAGQLGAVVVVHVGNNGIFSAAMFDEMMRTLAAAEQVIFVNDRVPRQWERPNNLMLAENVKRYPRAVLIDWYAAVQDRPELFWDDGMHLRPDGARLYAELIAAQVKPPAQ